MNGLVIHYPARHLKISLYVAALLLLCVLQVGYAADDQELARLSVNLKNLASGQFFFDVLRKLDASGGSARLFTKAREKTEEALEGHLRHFLALPLTQQKELLDEISSVAQSTKPIAPELGLDSTRGEVYRQLVQWGKARLASLLQYYKEEWALEVKAANRQLPSMRILPDGSNLFSGKLGEAWLDTGADPGMVGLSLLRMISNRFESELHWFVERFQRLELAKKVWIVSKWDNGLDSATEIQILPEDVANLREIPKPDVREFNQWASWRLYDTRKILIKNVIEPIKQQRPSVDLRLSELERLWRSGGQSVTQEEMIVDTGLSADQMTDGPLPEFLKRNQRLADQIKTALKLMEHPSSSGLVCPGYPPTRAGIIWCASDFRNFVSECEKRGWLMTSLSSTSGLPSGGRTPSLYDSEEFEACRDLDRYVSKLLARGQPRAP